MRQYWIKEKVSSQTGLLVRVYEDYELLNFGAFEINKWKSESEELLTSKLEGLVFFFEFFILLRGFLWISLVCSMLISFYAFPVLACFLTSIDIVNLNVI